MEDLLASLSIPQFIIDHRELPSSGRFQMAHATGKNPYTIVPLKVYEAILYFDTIILIAT